MCERAQKHLKFYCLYVILFLALPAIFLYKLSFRLLSGISKNNILFRILKDYHILYKSS